MEQDKELEGFLVWCGKEHEKFVDSVVVQKWGPEMVRAATAILVVYERMKLRLRSPLYKPYLGVALAFPADWAGLSITIGRNTCRWEIFTDVQAFLDYVASPARLPVGVNRFCFFSWDEVLTALQGDEKENRQLHIMADSISWCLVGIGGVKLNTAQAELPF